MSPRIAQGPQGPAHVATRDGEAHGIHQARLSRIENGQVDPKLSEAVEMARAVELDFVLAPRRALLAVLGVIRDFAGERRLTVPELVLGRKAE